MRIQRGMKGFTLIELAIVLVIIGLIIGAILKGGELIQSAKYKRLKMDWDSVLAAIYTYDDKYDALPGDDLDATGHVGGGVSNGDGNGWIGPTNNLLIVCDDPASTDERCQAWWHLREGDFLPGSGPEAPTHSFGGAMAIGNTTFTFSGQGWSQPWAVCHYKLQNKVALWLDEKYDDGKYDDGSIRGNDDYTTGPPDTEVLWTCIKG